MSALQYLVQNKRSHDQPQYDRKPGHRFCSAGRHSCYGFRSSRMRWLHRWVASWTFRNDIRDCFRRRSIYLRCRQTLFLSSSIDISYHRYSPQLVMTPSALPLSEGISRFYQPLYGCQWRRPEPQRRGHTSINQACSTFQVMVDSSTDFHDFFFADFYPF